MMSTPIHTVADLVAVLLALPQSARVIMCDTHEFESTIAAVEIDGGDVVICGGDPTRKYANDGSKS
jgi:hypothetical protein